MSLIKIYLKFLKNTPTCFGHSLLLTIECKHRMWVKGRIFHLTTRFWKADYISNVYCITTKL